MNKRMYLGILIVTIFATSNNQIVKAIEPISLAVGALIATGVSKGIDGLFSLFGSSKSAANFKERHEERRKTSKDEFILGIKLKRHLSTPADADRKILTNHELYNYQAFLDAIKETCPDYAEYIKILMQELNNNPSARIVNGFETDHLYHKAAGIFRKRAKDFSAFYILIQKLYAQVLIEESLAKNAPPPQETDAPSATQEPIVITND